MNESGELLKQLIGQTINQYTITQYISSGSFGDVFEVKHKKTDKLYAMKIPIQTEERDGQKCLLAEAKIYKEITNPEFGVADMKVIQDKNRKIIVMDLLGQSLESLITDRKKLQLKTVISIAIQMIDILKYIHSKGYIHRDIKPDNFVIGLEDKAKLYCIDYGLAKKYKKRNGEHVKFSNDKKFCGTARYASIAAHKNQEQSRKDDLEAIGYILIYLLKGKLPWQGIKNKDKKKRYTKIGELKETLSEEELCKGLPKEFSVFLKYCRNLDFDEKPHYSALKNMFVKLYESRCYKNNTLEYEK